MCACLLLKRPISCSCVWNNWTLVWCWWTSASWRSSWPTTNGRRRRRPRRRRIRRRRRSWPRSRGRPRAPSRASTSPSSHWSTPAASRRRSTAASPAATPRCALHRPHRRCTALSLSLVRHSPLRSRSSYRVSSSLSFRIDSWKKKRMFQVVQAAIKSPAARFVPMGPPLSPLQDSRHHLFTNSARRLEVRFVWVWFSSVWFGLVWLVLGNMVRTDEISRFFLC